MSSRFPRTALTLSVAVALTVAALTPAAALAKGPGGNGDCTADCTADQAQAQRQARARDGSGAQQVRNATRNTVRGRGYAGNGAGQGPAADGQRGPGSCDECTAEMGVLTDEQAAGVLFMANEEKLAHDVYRAFAEQYGVRVFANIADAEATHQEAVSVVLERYGLEDTASGLPAGEFSDPVIASLYTTLIEQGSASLEDALAVGVLIEETDIADLESRLEGLEEAAPDVYQMYSHLLAASQNHLAAFEGWL